MLSIWTSLKICQLVKNQGTKFVFHMVRNIVGKGEDANDQHFLSFTDFFSESQYILDHCKGN